MDTKTIKRSYAFFGFIFTVVAGSLLHFAFNYSEGNTLVGAFTPVNESVWEHLKLLLFPVILSSAAEFFTYGKESPSFISARTISLFVGMLSIILLFYTYSGISGSIDGPANIIIFIFSAAVVYLLTSLLMKSSGPLANETASIIAICALTAMIILFIYFTFNPPMSELFRDPISEDFGIIG